MISFHTNINTNPLLILMCVLIGQNYTLMTQDTPHMNLNSHNMKKLLNFNYFNLTVFLYSILLSTFHLNL